MAPPGAGQAALRPPRSFPPVPLTPPGTPAAQRHRGNHPDLPRARDRAIDGRAWPRSMKILIPQLYRHCKENSSVYRARPSIFVYRARPSMIRGRPRGRPGWPARWLWAAEGAQRGQGDRGEQSGRSEGRLSGLWRGHPKIHLF